MTTLAWCWKEWRAQRAVLLGYLLLAAAAIALVVVLVPRHHQEDEAFGARALSWFVIAGMLGVPLFAAPALVRGEFAGGSGRADTFVRRLPGALGPAFGGKIVFLVSVCVALPLAALGLGEAFLWLHGTDWNGIWTADWTGDVRIAWPPLLREAAAGLLLAPWVTAAGACLPGGRMAVGGVLALGLGLAVGAFGVVRSCPGLEKTLDGWPWLWAVAPSGALVGAFAWAKGRRGGGTLRSARFGLSACVALLAPAAGWLGAHAWRYHHPDSAALSVLHVRGLTPDGRHVLARAAAHDAHCPVLLRIDLATGACEQVAGVGAYESAEIASQVMTAPVVQRFWSVCDERLHGFVLDLATGAQHEARFDRGHGRVVVPEALRDDVLAALRAETTMRTAQGGRIWFEPDTLCVEAANGEVVRRPWQVPFAYEPCGHGFHEHTRRGGLYDATGTRRLDAKIGGSRGWIVRDGVLALEGGRWTWTAPGRPSEPCDALRGASVLGLLDDDRLLCCRDTRAAGADRPRYEVFVHRPADGAATPVAWPAGVATDFVDVAWGSPATLLARDRGRRVWLRSGCNRAHFVRVDPATLATDAVLPHDRGSYVLLAWPDSATVVVQCGARILRVDVASGAETVLFPR